MFDLDDDFVFDDEDLDKIFTGKALEKSSKFTSICDTEKTEEKENCENKSSFFKHAVDTNNDDDDELILSVIELEQSSKVTNFQSKEVNSSSHLLLPNHSAADKTISPIVCQRKFPGPAGLLPERTSNTLFSPNVSILIDPGYEDCSTLQKTVCSQNSTESFESGPWKRMMKDFKKDEDGVCFLSNFNVSWVKRKAVARQFVKHRVPFLAVLLTSLDCSVQDKASGLAVLLKDTTGEIHGTLHREVWDKFNKHLVIGSVLVLQQVRVLSVGVSTRQHYLNITVNNIATIYPPDSGFKIEATPIKKEEITKKISEWKNISINNSGVNSPSVKNVLNNIPRSLFSSSSKMNQEKSLFSLGEPVSKRTCNSSNTFLKDNSPSPFPNSSNKTSVQTDARKPNLSHHATEVCNNSLVPSVKNTQDCNQTCGFVESQNSLIENMANKTSINNEELSVLTSVLEGIDADMFDDF